MFPVSKISVIGNRFGYYVYRTKVEAHGKLSLEKNESQTLSTGFKVKLYFIKLLLH